MHASLDALSDWSVDSNRTLNPSKTKAMLLLTQQMSRVHSLDENLLTLIVNEIELKRHKTVKLLGTRLHRYRRN